MSVTGLDAAIRKAIDRAQAHDAPARQRVYRSARMALEKGIAQRPDLDSAAIETQRRRFDELVRKIEAEKTGDATLEPDRPAAAEPPAIELDTRAQQTAAYERDVPAVEPLQKRDAPVGPVPAVAAGTGAPAATFDGLATEIKAERPSAPPAEKESAAKPKRATGGRRKTGGAARLFSALFLLVSLLVFGALGFWLLDKTGLIEETNAVGGGANTFTKFDTAANGMPDLVTEDGFVGAWKPVFLPGKDGKINLGPAAKKTPVKAERGRAVRLTSTTAGSDGNIRIALPADLLNAMAGRVSTIALNVRGVDGQQTQIAVECAFATAGGCSRRRFDVHAEMTDVVFKVDLTGAAPPDQPGALVLNTDIEGKGRSVDLFAIGLRAVK